MDNINNKKTISEILVLKNGNICVFDKNDEQIPNLQKKTLLEVFCGWAESHGYVVHGAKFSAPYGSGKIVSGREFIGG